MHHHSLRDTSTADGICFTKNHYIEYRPGTLNVILSVPHGGRLRPKTIPNRDFGSIINDKLVFDHRLAKDPLAAVKTKDDLFTIELTLALADALHEYTGRYPYVVINHLHRQKLDCNADEPEATFGVPEAVDAWNAYHEFINLAKLTMGNHGLFIDIHGHSHAERWIELGYTISREQLNTMLYTAADTSLHELFRRIHAKCQTVEIQQLICGPLSLGGLIEAISGFSTAVVPSPQHPKPGNGQYFKGGYNVMRHGSRFEGFVDAVQIESPLELRMPELRASYADCLGKAIAMFLQQYYYE
jgi:hypothetical protein